MLYIYQGLFGLLAAGTCFSVKIPGLAQFPQRYPQGVDD
jgi:hypothetical protein